MISLKPLPAQNRLYPARRGAFTLIEMLVAMAVLSLLMVAISSIMNHTTATVKTASSKLDAFQAARAGFDLMSQKLSQATLNTYWDYDNPSTPTKYTRRSDLHFLTKQNGGGQSVYFQSPEAQSSNSNYDQTQGLLNACGFYVEFGNDTNADTTRWRRPAHVGADRYRYRLMQAVQPAENLKVFANATDDTWLTAGTSVNAPAWPIADNVIALIIQPREELSSSNSIAPNYLYDSRNGTAIQKAQLPPIVQLTMVVIDESSAARFANGSTAPSVIQNALTGKFTNVSQYKNDLDALEAALVSNGIRYQIFSSSVMLRESKWSSTPTP